MALEVERTYRSTLFWNRPSGARATQSARAIQSRLANSSRYSFYTLAVVDITSIHLRCRGSSYSAVRFVEVGYDCRRRHDFGSHSDSAYYCHLWLFWEVGGDGCTQKSGLPLRSFVFDKSWMVGEKANLWDSVKVLTKLRYEMLCIGSELGSYC